MRLYGTPQDFHATFSQTWYNPLLFLFGDRRVKTSAAMGAGPLEDTWRKTSPNSRGKHMAVLAVYLLRLPDGWDQHRANRRWCGRAPEGWLFRRGWGMWSPVSCGARRGGAAGLRRHPPRGGAGGRAGTGRADFQASRFHQPVADGAQCVGLAG